METKMSPKFYKAHYKALLYSTGIALACLGNLSLTAQAGPRSYADVRSNVVQSDFSGTTKRSMLIPYGKASTIDLPGGIADVVVASPSIVDAVVHTQTRVLLIGKNPGQTNVFFYDASG
ncbi:MAG: pilus assembly protein N-terminal domain-containing protein, partial [Rhodobacteraceae bacterium]|nr:pilus assembly protein N-terminal domain-containing protein [Paracoccaceae bacterium]